MLHNEEGFLCSHGRALLVRLGKSPSDPGWCASRCHIGTHLDSYGKSPPAMATHGKLRVDDTLAPPDQTRAAGRPPKKRKERTSLRKTDVRRACCACGELGHFAMTCDNPCTSYRYYKHKAAALEWIKKQDLCYKAVD